MRGRVNTTGHSEGNEKREFALLPDGPYQLTITDYSEKTTANGDPMVNITMEVLANSYNTDKQFHGRKLWDNIVIPSPESPAIKILGRTKHFFHCIGEPFEGDIEYDTDCWIGKVCIAEVFTEEWQGKKRNKIGNYMLDESLENSRKVPPAINPVSWKDEEEGPGL